MPDRQIFYFTTPIYYVNDAPHIGHAYTTLACDVLARFKRLDGYRVMFLTGTDEHGQKVEKSAQAAGMETLAFCDKVSQNFRELADALNCSHDDFIRTTEPRHHKASQELWRRLEASGEIYLDSYAGWYSVRDEAFYGEGEIEDGPDGGKVAPSGAPVEWVEEPSYFFRLSNWGDRLLEYYDTVPETVLPKTRRNEVASFVKSGLRDLSISRTSFKWGVPVPGDEDHIMYVWVDALTNYLTAVGFPDDTSESFTTFWPAVMHVVGKDILRFHAVYWPALLMAAGLTPPTRVFAHGWWTNEGQKISKSLGNVIDPYELIAEYGLDAMRYFLMREVPFGNDGDFSRTAMINRTNGDLANDLGNLAQRCLSMIAKNCGGKLPAPGALTEADQALLGQADALLAECRGHIEVQAIHRMLETVWAVVAGANGYFANEEPWALKDSDPERMNTVLYVTAEVVRQVSILAQPVVPGSAARLLDQLGVAGEARDFAALGEAGRLTPGTALPAPEGVFPRYDAKKAE